MLVAIFLKARAVEPTEANVVFVTLIAAGVALGHLLQRLLRWAEGPASTGAIAALPWLAVVLIALPMPDRLTGTGSALGPLKYSLSAAWIAGVIIYGFLLLPPLLREFNPRRLAAGFAALALLANSSISVQPPNESDECDYVAAALALSRTGTTSIYRIVQNGDLRALYFNHLPSSWEYYEYVLKHVKGTNLYSLRMVAYPTLLAPFVAIARHVDTPAARWFILHLPSWIGYAVFVYALALIMARFGAGRRTATVALAGAAPYIYYASNTQPETWLAAGVAWCLYLAMRSREDPALTVRTAVLATALMLLHERMAIFSAVFVLDALMRSPRRMRLIAASAAVFALVLVSYAGVQQFGWPKAPHAYGQGRFFPGFGPWLRVMWDYLVSVSIGIFPRVPLLLVLLFAAPNLGRPGARLGLTSFSVYFFFMTSYPDARDSWPHIRYMVPALPALFPLLDGACNALENKSWGTVVIRLLGGIQILCAWPLLAIPPLWRALNY